MEGLIARVKSTRADFEGYSINSYERVTCVHGKLREEHIFAKKLKDGWDVRFVGFTDAGFSDTAR